MVKLMKIGDARGHTFTCKACLEVRDFYSEAVIMGCKPEQAQIWVTGVPCIITGFCMPCLDEEGLNE